MKFLLLASLVACGEKTEDTAAETEEIVDTDDATDSGDTNDTDDTDPEEDACSAPEGSENADPATLEGRIECGAEVYAMFCANCHGPEGAGEGPGPALFDRIENESDADLINLIQNGQGPMPSVNLEPQQMADVIAWLRDTF